MNVASPHRPVMCRELIDSVVNEPNGTYLDATFGCGGHTSELLKRLSADARLIALDRDPAAIEVAEKMADSDPRLQPAHESFSNLDQALTDRGITELSGAMFDLGVSSPQLDDPNRGFSFVREGPLDMRMDTSRGMTAAEWLDTVDRRTLARVLRRYGDEQNAGTIARAIVESRPLETTAQLVDLINRTVPRPDPRKHPARRVFQALRMQINDELAELTSGLVNAWQLLKHGGRLAVVSFHSLEHRLVRRLFRGWVNPPVPRNLPLVSSGMQVAQYIVKRARPTDAEIVENPRARSAMLQVIARV